jgi:hypothetical protein
VPPVGPIKRSELIRALRTAGFAGPFRGTRHQVMIRGGKTIALPNPHRGDISVDLLLRVLRETGISRQEWEQL